MNHQHLRTGSVSYAVITSLTGLAAWGVGNGLVGFVVLSTLVVCLLLLALKSRLDWKQHRQQRNNARKARRRQAKTAVDPKPFRDRLAPFVHHDETDAETNAEFPRPSMPFRCVVDVAHATPVRPKSADFIRRTLMRIRSILRRSRRTTLRDQ